MDTRTKIVDASEARRIAQSGANIVSGYFDPLIADFAERLAELKQDDRALLVLIETPQDEILSAAARAALVAGLDAVDYVCTETNGITPSVRLETEHRDRVARLIHHVHARQQAK